MRDTQNPATVIMAVIFGALIGMITLILLAWQAGFLDWDNKGQARSAALSATPGMDILNDYQCRKQETKKIILGGVEDGFSSGNEEAVSGEKIRAHYAQRHGAFGALELTRSYDERGVDNIFFDEFSFPPNVAHGIIVTKFQELSTLKNDSFSLGNLFETHSHQYGTAIVNMPNSKIWSSQHGTIWANLSNLTFAIRETPDGSILPQIHKSLLELVAASEPVTVRVADDTMVDFIGFAVCSSPAERKGTTYRINSNPMPENFVSLTCDDSDGAIQCNPYKGDTVCETRLPLACFFDKFQSPPLALTSLHNKYYWSGGEVKFSAPIAGSEFETQDEVHNFCKAEFGNEWRALTTHDGGMASIITAQGRPPNSEKVWIDVKTQPYGNCWELRPDYDETKN